MHRKMQQPKLLGFSAMGILLFVIAFSPMSVQSEEAPMLGPCEAIMQLAAKEQLCYRLNESILTYKELLAACPDDSSSKHQMGISYVLLGKSEIGLAYMQEAVDDLKAAGKSELAKQLQDAGENWKRNISTLTPQNVETARKKAEATKECKELIMEYWNPER